MAKPFPWMTLVKVGVSVALLGALAAWADLGKIGSALSGFSAVWVIPLLVLIAASVAVSASKWGVLLRAQGLPLRFGELFGAYSTALFFNNFLPSSIGGDGVRILLVGRSTGQSPAVGASVVIERALATVSLGLLGLVTGLVSRHPQFLALGLLGAVALVGATLTAILVSGWLPKTVRSSKKKWAQFFVEFAESARILRSRPSALWSSLAQSFVFQTLVAGVVAAVATALGLPFWGVADVIYVTSAASVLAMIPLGLNGFGLREGAFIVLLQPYGVDAASALAVSVLFALSVSVYSLSGAGFWIATRQRISA